MALTERSRHRLYEALGPIIDDEQAVQEMLSYFPARDVEEPVTKDFLRAELQTEIGALRSEMHAMDSALREEIGTLRSEMHAEIGALRSEMHAEVGTLRAEMHAMDSALRDEISSLRTEVRAGDAALRIEIGSLRTEMERMVRTMQTWLVGTAISLGGLIVAVARFG